MFRGETKKSCTCAILAKLHINKTSVHNIHHHAAAYWCVCVYKFYCKWYFHMHLFHLPISVTCPPGIFHPNRWMTWHLGAVLLCCPSGATYTTTTTTDGEEIKVVPLNILLAGTLSDYQETKRLVGSLKWNEIQQEETSPGTGILRMHKNSCLRRRFVRFDNQLVFLFEKLLIKKQETKALKSLENPEEQKQVMEVQHYTMGMACCARFAKNWWAWLVGEFDSCSSTP